MNDNELLKFLKKRQKVVNTFETGYDLIHYVQWSKSQGNIKHTLKLTKQGHIDVVGYERMLTYLQGGKQA